MSSCLNLPHLNLDVLLVILQHVEERIDVSSFVKTCKAFHRLSAHHLLDPRLGKVHLSRQSQVSSFCRFMSTEPSGSLRVGSLRQLHATFSFLEGPVELAYGLADIVQRSVNIQELTFKDDSLEELLAVGGQAALNALIHLKSHTNLKQFSTGEINDRGLELLRLIETDSITDLGISYFPLSLDDPWISVSAIPILRKFHSSVTNLDLTNFDLTGVDSIQCPLVRTLRLELYGPPTLPTITLIHAFPNVDTFILERDMEDFTWSQDTLRRNNKLPESLFDAYWENLRYVEGKPTELYILRLPCHVHELHMKFDLGNCNRHHILRVLQDSTPTVVEFSVEDSTNYAPAESYFLSPLIDKLRLSHTSRLRLQVSLIGNPWDIERYLSYVVNALSQPSALQYVWFDMESCTHDWIIRAPDRSVIPGIVRKYLESMDAEREALSIAKVLPSLKRIGFDIFKSEKARGFWDVVRSDTVGSDESASLLRLDSLADEGSTRREKFWNTMKDQRVETEGRLL